ncbi:MAG TPA: hypothetical protein DDW65_19035 [Firmicutes bacterium]|nr:hypothetical protein [Bacillota bacterium]
MMSSLREKAHEIVDRISERKLAEIIDFLEYLKIKEEVEATNEILNDKKMVESIQKGLIQSKNNELVDLENIREDV